MAKVYKTTFKLRRGKAAEWASVNPVLAIGEPGFEVDTFKLKIGNGSAAYNDLPYIADASALYSSNGDGSVVFLNTSNELPTEGISEILYVILQEKQIKTWNSTTASYDEWLDKTSYVTVEQISNYATIEQVTQVTEQVTNITEQITNVTEQVTNVSESVSKVEQQVTNIVEVSVEDVAAEDESNKSEVGETLFVRKNGMWIPLTSDNPILQQVTQQLIESTSKDYGSIDDEV